MSSSLPDIGRVTTSQIDGLEIRLARGGGSKRRRSMFGACPRDLRRRKALLPSIATPVLVPAGRNDAIVPPPNGQLLADLLPHCRHTLLDGGISSGRMLPHQNNLGGLMDALLKTCTGSGDACGKATPELIQALAGSPVRLFSPYQTL
jgi:hypothetical protein